MVVTRLVATGTTMDTFSSRKSFKISLEDCAQATLMYVGAGVGLLVLGLAAVMILKKRGGAVAAAPATN